MKSNLISFTSGVIFAVGLVISGMTDPQKVLGFLDVLGEWDYSLALVMAGAVGFNLFAWRLVLKRRPWCGSEFHLPQGKKLDWKLLTGATLFGVGWGLAGICPGPALVNLVTLDQQILIFVGAMLAGMLFFKFTEKRLP